MSAYNFFVSGQKFTKFFSPNREGVRVDQLVFRFSLSLFGDYLQLRSKSKVVKNRAKFWTFFALLNFVGGGFPKSPKSCSTLFITPASRHVAW